ncbi:methionine aminotransferase [Sabulilitoribacter arenilitoris]|uniref:Methionine aminotransferase n=1 Tax=Wocania arenilitoris TaxID=2044858 RepID=A0AAE3EPW1_9FLAO|nr:methionine aminotransferase [Wocania arenilitoris]MCF7568412.1 methionine aminotransferase [Wocania arenilitoris]
MQNKSKLPNVGTTIFTVMGALAKKHNAINLSQGFPDFKMDAKLIDLVTKAMQNGHNQYAPMQGSIELREAIAKKFDLLYSTSYHPETEITITTGATEAIFSIISAFIKANDEVIIFSPAYDCYEPAIELQGGKTISIELKSPNFKVDWNAVKTKINNRTKMIIINTPQNPIGTVFSEVDMLQLQEITKGTNIIVLSDEVYEHIVFDGKKHQSACLFSDLKSRSFVVASFGKTFHNTGWRIGYCCASKELMSEFRKVHQFNVFCVNHPMQKALAEYLENENNYLEIAAFYQEKRDLFLSLVKDSRFKFTPSKGTYFQLLDYSAITQENDVDFAKRLTIENKLASIPISVLYNTKIESKILRFCFAKKDETLKQAADILNGI